MYILIDICTYLCTYITVYNTHPTQLLEYIQYRNRLWEPILNIMYIRTYCMYVRTYIILLYNSLGGLASFKSFSFCLKSLMVCFCWLMTWLCLSLTHTAPSSLEVDSCNNTHNTYMSIYTVWQIQSALSDIQYVCTTSSKLPRRGPFTYHMSHLYSQMVCA